MGTKQSRPMLDVQTVQQRLSRTEQAYLKNLFIYLCKYNSAAPSSAAAASGGPSHLNQSHTSAALALGPSNLELLQMRLPRATVIRVLLAPSFPTLSSAMLDRCCTLFSFQGHAGGLDYNEYLVMLYTLWYGHAHEELAKFLFTLMDTGGNGKVGRKEYRRGAAPLWADQAAWIAQGNAMLSGKSAAAAPMTGAGWLIATASGSKSSSSSSSVPVALPVPDSSGGKHLEREWLSALFDLYVHLALDFFDRDRDQLLSLAEFTRFAEEDLLLSSFMSRKTDARMHKQRVQQMLGCSYAQIMRGGAGAQTTPIAGAAASPSVASARGASPAAAASAVSLSSASAAPPPAWRTFLGDSEVEESTGVLWRTHTRNTLRPQQRTHQLGAV